MGNMSYCKFENTMRDLQDCILTLSSRVQISERELSKAEDMLKVMSKFMVNEGLMIKTEDYDEYSEEIINEMKEDDEEDDEYADEYDEDVEDCEDV